MWMATPATAGLLGALLSSNVSGSGCAKLSASAAIDPAVQRHLVRAIARTAPLQWTPPEHTRLPDGLTSREATVLALIAEGLSNPEITERLTVTETTVKSHIKHLHGKRGHATEPRPSLTLTSTASHRAD